MNSAGICKILPQILTFIKDIEWWAAVSIAKDFIAITETETLKLNIPVIVYLACTTLKLQDFLISLELL